MSEKTTTKAAAKVSTGSSKQVPSATDAKNELDRSSDPIAAQAEQYAAMMDARNKFIGVTVGLGWRLAITVLVPLFIGVQLDNHFHTSPSYTLAAFFLAMFISAVVVWDTVKDLNAQQAKDDLKDKKEATK